ncbi:MAG TPA: alpha/beta hydrolase [Egicoccus sp.]|nr:alpha/beta hydrolase [Egicoccus sp.]HSK22541.1 alpha/beta hydrolase [Egicoccus sp.]
MDRQMQVEAATLRDLADRDLADVAVWDELQALTASINNPVRSSEQRDDDLARYEQVLAQVDAAPDGSLLAELRDTEPLRRDTFRDPDETERLLAVLDRIERARHADELADLLAGWAASDRRFVHLEVDLDDGTALVAEVVRGDLDAADHVAVVIPGTGSDAGNFDRSTREHGLALSETLELVPGGEDVAVIACLCYAPPPGLLQAAGSAHADAGGHDLARIVGNLPLGDAEIHALGHSYGATALGRAVDREGLELASTISLGGPGFGAGVGSVDDLPGGAGRVWAMRHDLDPIDLAGMHGRNPDRDDFGAYRADVGDGDLERSRWKPYQFAAHSIYYQDDESLTNLALVVSGQHEAVSGYREGRR